ncbi:hypothetical protein K0M31_006592 [Melipona bicolor]|uniref:Uncharacterized protein n=1 Tax=Melipona bicolor TaxID=60889 RepID=A0AA40KKW7_9HYME|nr:hypothetical protein K0M31_006592 [Melipona bicolor]
MQGTTCENLSSKPKPLVHCGCLFDERTRARLERENQETLKGLLALESRKKIRKKEELELQRKDKHKDEQKEAQEDEKLKDLKFTKWSKLKILRKRKENKKWEEYLNRYEKWIFCAALIKLKVE